MKKLYVLLAILIGLTTLSCSSDNSDQPTTETINEPVDEPVEEPVEISEKILSRILQKSYNQGILKERITFIYENSRPKIDSFYNSDNQLTYYSKWLYNEDGLLSNVNGFLPSGEINNESSFDYDNSNRLIENVRIEENGTFTTTSSFTYNSDNTITSITDSNGSATSSKTFLANSSGLVFKEISENYTSEVEFDIDNNPVQKISTNGSILYTLNHDILKKGIFLNLWKNIFGPELNNTILWGNSLDNYADSYGNKYVIRQENGDDTNRFEYSFDAQNYPTNKSSYYNDVLTSELEYVYE